jgi:hypothetical protein
MKQKVIVANCVFDGWKTGGPEIVFPMTPNHTNLTLTYAQLPSGNWGLLDAKVTARSDEEKKALGEYQASKSVS